MKSKHLTSLAGLLIIGILLIGSASSASANIRNALSRTSTADIEGIAVQHDIQESAIINDLDQIAPDICADSGEITIAESEITDTSQIAIENTIDEGIQSSQINGETIEIAE